MLVMDSVLILCVKRLKNYFKYGKTRRPNNK